MAAAKKNKNKTNKAFKTAIEILAFLNVLEGRRTRLSITQCMMWLTLWLAIYLAVNSPEYLADALWAFSAATINYIAKKFVSNDYIAKKFVSERD